MTAFAFTSFNGCFNDKLIQLRALLELEKVPSEHEIILFSFQYTWCQNSGNYHLQGKLLSESKIFKAPQLMHIHEFLLKYDKS